MSLNLLRKLIVTCAFLLMIIAAGAPTSDVLGQCGSSIYDRPDVFRTVSNQYKEKLMRRVEMFLRQKCEENFGELYEMMISSFRESNRKKDFINDMQTYYSGNDRFVSFIPMKISEFVSSKEKVVSFWFIEGCITEVINGGKRSTKTVLEAYIEGDEIFFTDITTRPNPLGIDEKCKSSRKADGKSGVGLLTERSKPGSVL